MIQPRGILYLAGLLEGEGYFALYRRTNRPSHEIRITLTMTDRDVVERAACLMGVPVKGPFGPYGAGKKEVWQLHVYGVAAIGWLMTLYQFMGIRRRARIAQLLTVWRNAPCSKYNRHKKVLPHVAAA